MKITAPILFIFFICLSLYSQEISPKYFAVEIDVVAKPSNITLKWKTDPYSIRYIISKKLKEDSAFVEMGQLPGDSEVFTDSSIKKGSSYEYKIERIATYFDSASGKTYDYSAFGYVNAGIEATAVEYRGKVLLLVDHTLEDALSSEINRLKEDIAAEGWKVKILYAPRSEDFSAHAVQTVKKIIKKEYNQPGEKLRTVFLLGRLPVPYSGELAVDGHFPDHFGAWPADAYYAEMYDFWSDDTASKTVKAMDNRNNNVPYDGKFDPVFLSSPAELELGRVDLYKLPVMHNNELNLYKNYLSKNHNYRIKNYELPRRALIADGFQIYGSSKEAAAAGSWSDFSALFGTDSVKETFREIRDIVKKDSYAMTYMGYQGGYNSILEFAYTDDYRDFPLKVGFPVYFGSWNADWDSEDNLLRAALASKPYTVGAIWSGRPYWHLHHLGMGETFGYSVKLTMNNVLLYDDYSKYGRRLIHIAFMGDPTLKLHIVAPPKNVIAAKEADSIKFTWQAPAESNIASYIIYKMSETGSKPVKIAEMPANNLTYTFREVSANDYYIIKAVKLEKSSTGSYYNLSPGVIVKP